MNDMLIHDNLYEIQKMKEGFGRNVWRDKVLNKAQMKMYNRESKSVES